MFSYVKFFFFIGINRTPIESIRITRNRSLFAQNMTNIPGQEVRAGSDRKTPEIAGTSEVVSSLAEV